MIVAGMATMPERLEFTEQVVESIRPQVGAVRVYLNNFRTIPGFLHPEEAVLSSNAAGDLGAEGKMYWIDGKDGLNDYTDYLTIDDDIGYPPDYVEVLKRELDARKGRAIVGVHASTFTDPITDFVKSRAERFRFTESLDAARRVHLLGTATTMWGRHALQLCLEEDFPMRNATDLQLAVAAQKQGVPMVAIPRDELWMTELRPWDAEGESVWKNTKVYGIGREAKTRLAQEAIREWILYPDPIEAEAA